MKRENSLNILFFIKFLFDNYIIAKMGGLFTLLEVDSGIGSSSNDTKTRVPNIRVEITGRCRLNLEWD